MLRRCPIASALALLPLIGSAIVASCATPTDDRAAPCAYFVAVTGSDDHDGRSAATAFATLETARSAARRSACKTVYLGPGTYKRSRPLELTSEDSGERWTYLAAAGVNSAVLDGGGTVDLIDIKGAFRIAIDGLKLQNFRAYGIKASDAPHLTVENADIGHNVVSSWDSAGIVIGGGSPNATVRHNYVHDIGSQGIALFDGYNRPTNIDGGVIEGNVVLKAVQRKSDGGAIYVSMHGGTQTSQVTVSNNFVRDYGAAGVSGAVGIYLDDSASHVTVTGNVVGPPTEGSVGSGNFGAAGIEFHNGHDNTVRGNIIDLGDSGRDFAATFGYDSGSVAGMAGNVFAGNVIVASFTGAQRTLVSGLTGYTYPQTPRLPASDFTIRDNVYYNAAGGEVRTDGNVASDTHPILANPLLRGWHYRPAADSPIFKPPVSFRPITGGWGPPNFAVPNSPTHTSTDPESDRNP